ncbi:MAG: DUF192 domain-containing protein [Halobacteriales archaeon]
MIDTDTTTDGEERMTTGVVRRSTPGGTSELAGAVLIIESPWDRLVGLWRLSRRDDVALVFEYQTRADRRVTALGMPVGIDVIWLESRTVQRVQTVGPWWGIGRYGADTVLELPAGHASEVGPGDEIEW